MGQPTPLKLFDPDRLARIVVVGAGGTGSYVTGQLCALLNGLKARGRSIPAVLVVDGDTVEQKNLVRQYFLECDVGRNKASVLAERYARAYGLAVGAHPRYLDSPAELSTLASPTSGYGYSYSVFVGCVDNAATRRLLHEGLQERYKNVVYIDAGNEAVSLPDDPEHADRYRLARARDSGWSGQVIAGVRAGCVNHVPFPAEVIPGLIEGEDDLPTNDAACGEVAASEPQRHLTNHFAAVAVMGFLNHLVSEGSLVNCRTFFDARSGYMRSDPASLALLELGLPA